MAASPAPLPRLSPASPRTSRQRQAQSPPQRSAGLKSGSSRHGAAPETAVCELGRVSRIWRHRTAERSWPMTCLDVRVPYGWAGEAQTLRCKPQPRGSPRGRCLVTCPQSTSSIPTKRRDLTARSSRLSWGRSWPGQVWSGNPRLGACWPRPGSDRGHEAEAAGPQPRAPVPTGPAALGGAVIGLARS